MIADGGASHVDGIEWSAIGWSAWKLNTPLNGVQCKCTTRETYYVKGVEHMGVVFEHGYSTTTKAGGLKGSSLVKGHGLSTQVGPNRFQGGDHILMSLEQIIALNAQGHTLDTKNHDVRKDKRDTLTTRLCRTSARRV